jgi:hypothetical protein
MGAACCREAEKIDPNSLKLMYAQETKINKQTKFFIQTFDLENEKSYEVEINLRFLRTLEGMSQYVLNNALYLCGGPKTIEGSFFIKYESNKPQTNSISLLINTIFSHYYPALCSFKGDYLICVGGKETVKCESYHKKTNRWKLLPDLPEERYGCSLVADESSEIIYLFGGYSTETNKHFGSILMLNIRTGEDWETLLLKSNYNLLCRSLSAIVKNTRDTILILGGRTDDEKESKQIIEVNLKKADTYLYPIELKEKAKFPLSQAFDYTKSFYFLDTKEFIHKIGKKDNLISIIGITDLNTY